MSPRKPRFDVLGQMGALRRYARSLTRDATDAEDLVHDALVRAYERRTSFKPGGSMRAWLLSILHNAFIDGVRSRNSEAGRAAESARMSDTALGPLQEHSVRLSQAGMRPWDRYSTLAGYTLWRPGHLPKAGEAVSAGTLEFEVVSMAERNIDKVRVRALTEAA